MKKMDKIDMVSKFSWQIKEKNCHNFPHPWPLLKHHNHNVVKSYVGIKEF